MAGHKLKISADTSDVKKSLLDLKRVIQKDMGKSNIELFSKNTNELLKRGAAKEFEKLNKEAKKLTDQINDQTKALMKAKQGTKEYAQEYSKLIEMTKRMVGVAGQRQEMGGIAQTGLAGKPSDGSGGIGGTLLRGLSSLKANPAALLATAGVAYGLSRAVSGWNLYKQGIGSRISLRGRGFRDLGLKGGEVSKAGEYGLNENEFLQQQMQAVDVFGRGGASNASVLQRARFERAYGLTGTGALTNAGANIATQVGGKGAEEAVLKLQASLIASGITDRIGPYLEVAANMLTNINARGLSDSGDVFSALSILAARTKDAPEIITSILSNLDASIRGATGEKSAFFQGAFARAGIGGGTIMGTKLAMSTGIFGINQENIPPAWKSTFKQLGLDAGFQQKASAISKEMGRYGLGPTSKRSGESLFAMMELGNISDPIKAAKAMEYLRIAEKTQTPQAWKKAEQELRGATDQTVEQNLTDIKASGEGSYDLLTKISESVRIGIGADGVNLGALVQGAILNIDKQVAAIAAFILPAKKFVDDRFEDMKPRHVRFKEQGEEWKRILSSGSNITSEDLLKQQLSDLIQAIQDNTQATRTDSQAVQTNTEAMPAEEYWENLLRKLPGKLTITIPPANASKIKGS